MRYALTRLPQEPFARAEAQPTSKPVLNGIWQIPGSDGLIHSILYWVNKNDPQGSTPPSTNDAQYRYWEYPIQAWVAGNGGAVALPGGQEDCFIDPRTNECIPGQTSPSDFNNGRSNRNNPPNNGTVPR
jgi:hypothetical protein